MSDERNAVFLSYASQDAEPAQRICEALRAAGVEVWFDQSELRGGDSWDAKIRKQIKECALFVPIISANTQARPEGYFRLEWKLAVDRSHLLADDHPFLFPIAIGEVPEASARVPDKFREVQWSRLRLDENPSEIAARVDRLLRGATVSGPFTGRAAEAAALPRTARRQWRRWPVFPILGIAVGLAFALMPLWRARTAAGPKPAPVTGVPSSRTSEIARRATIETRDQLEAAIDVARRATEKTPDSAQAWAALARLEGQFIRRGWDISEARRQVTQAAANRALAIDPQNTDAANALSIVLLQQRAFTQVEALMRAAVARSPNDRELRGALGNALSGQGRDAEALAVREETLRLFPKDPLAHYDLALSYEKRPTPDFDSALRKFEDSLALQRLTSTLLHKASLLAGWKGDLVGARQVLDGLDPLERTGDRAVGIAMTIGLLEHKPERAIEAAGLTARNYFDDDYVPGPKAWYLAHAYAMAGKQSLAQAQWREAAMVLRQRAAAKPGNWFEEGGLAVTLAWSGAAADAAHIMGPLESVARESPDPLRTLYMAYYFAGRGDAPSAVPYLRRLLNRRELLTDHTLPLDTWWEKLRGRPEFEVLLAEGAARRAAPKTMSAAPTRNAPPEKSVAVLAFENRSSERDSEYFSDGISEELLNVLAKVPGLKVLGRSSSFHFKGRNEPPQEVGRKLNVGYLVEGSVQRSGTQARIIARLIRADSGEQIWGDGFDSDLKDILGAQQDIARAIAEKLSVAFGTTPRARPVSPVAHRLVLQGRYFVAQRWAGFEPAAKAFTEAVQIDPNFAPAHAGVAEVNMLHGVYIMADGRGPVDDKFTQAKISARRAMDLDPSLAEPHATLGLVLFMERQWAEAERHFQETFRLNPNNGMAYHWHGLLLGVVGKLDRALEALARSVDLDPLGHTSFFTYGGYLVAAGRFAESLAAVDRGLPLATGAATLPVYHSIRAVALHHLGRTDEAVATARLVRQLPRGPDHTPHWWADGDAIYVLHRAGHAREAEEYLREVQRNAGSRSYIYGYALCALGRFDEGLPLLASADPMCQSKMYFMPMFDSLHEMPGFREVFAKLNSSAEYELARETIARLRQEGPKK